MLNINLPEKYDNDVLEKILDKVASNSLFNSSEMTDLERKFLNGVIRQVKPKKILEVGVAAGGGSSIMLNAIKDINDSFLYSIDYSKEYYRDTSKDTGFIVNDNFDYLKSKWKLYTGGGAAKFIEEIGPDIDLCLLDTVHANPGEFLDFLVILPYMKKNAVIIIHDISISDTCLTLFNCIRGEKISFNDKNELFNNYGIGAIILDDNIMNYIFDYFFLLKLDWKYMLKDEDIEDIIRVFLKVYDKKYVEFFTKIVNYQKDKIGQYFEINIKEIQYINKLSWFIPFRDIRDNFRLNKINKLKNKKIKESKKNMKYFYI
ncbi:class I SAM-dependent methyltransferase [Brachyspira intermedia]|uniref:class I SAM-dependent methyltransferase n=1 Tax=Brachyspira intermedia TaxID=84377 RepID=UPI0030055DF1